MKKTLLFVVLATLCLIFSSKAQDRIILSGKITDQQNQPLPGVTIKIKGTNTAGITNSNGTFSISLDKKQGTLIISFLGYNTTEINFNGTTSNLQIQLSESQNDLNEVQVIGYGQTTKRLNTGSVSTVTAKQIEQQPVTNVLSALSGRMPGVFVQTTNGLPGGNINIQIRGKGSMAAGTAPLYIIDGVPFESSLIVPTSVLASSTMTGAINPLNSINPADVESINILKDADATSIYGSRGSNGVILITTKKSGQAKTSISVNQGFSQVANTPELLNLNDYLAIRKEAFANDNLSPTTGNAPDLLLWNQTQGTDWGKYAFDHTAKYTDVQSSINGGNQQTTFNASTGFHQENTILSKQAKYLRGSLHAGLNYNSLNQKFNLQLSNSLVIDENSSPNLQNLSSDLILPPNYPLLNADGQYNWFSTNPQAEQNASTSAKTDNLVSNIILSYAITSNLSLKLSGGYNKINIDQNQLYPANALSTGSVNYAQYGQNSSRSYLAEPQLIYNIKRKNSNLNLLLGGTYQNRLSESWFFKASNFSNEELMENIASATTIDTRTNNYTRYNYVSAFARANYQFVEKYILNATIRRDGSSRFGNGNRFGTFGSVGGAWIFSEEDWLAKKQDILSFGKLRASYGTVGNDQIPDYQYLSSYTGNSGFTYQGIATLRPARLDNADFHWETTQKFDIALELGWLKNRILFNINYYNSKSRDQLVQYNLPRLTGFASYQANLPAVVQNTGWEMELNTINLKSKLSWSSTFNLTIPRNKLVSFQNFESSSYAQTFKLGYDITRIYGYTFLGVNPETGSASYADRNGAASTAPYNFNTLGKQTPDLYGGLGNTLSYKNFNLDIFLQFAKQMSVGGIRSSPGLIINNYAMMTGRWQQQGDLTGIPKASTIFDLNYSASSANFFDTSYIRLKNVSLNYQLPGSLARQLKISGINLFARAQNLITWWDENSTVADPESGAISASAQRNIPPVKSFVAGIEIKL